MRGFSLVDLMASVAIAGILATLALPAYHGYVVRAHRLAGKTALLDAASRQESYWLEHKAYADSLAAFYPVDGQGYAWFSGDGSSDAPGASSAIYRVRLPVADPTGYRLEAEPVHAQARDTDCGTLGYDSLGQRSASGPLGPACWR